MLLGRAGKSMHVVTSAIEHKAVLAAAHVVVSMGGRETILPVDHNGQVRLDALDAALAEGPALVSVMWVNNEVGTVQPMAEIGARCRAAGVPLHSDAVQSFGKLPIALDEVGCSLLSISGHKLGAPKGIGALIVRDRHIVDALIHGGGQQYGIRPGTENVAGAVALGRAALLGAAGARTRTWPMSAHCVTTSPSDCRSRSLTWWCMPPASSARRTSSRSRFRAPRPRRC
ncbi:MAG: aminotransferase class V-fold PLP-dependent enzyme [Gemmatimonadales bacterium]